MEFLVTLTCAVAMSCPLPSNHPIVTPFNATSAHDCKARVERMLISYHQNAGAFHIKCSPK